MSARYLESLGVPRRTIWRRCEPGGPWQLLLPGIVLLRSGTPTDEQRIRAALVHGREGAMVTGIHALRRYGLVETPEPAGVHILVPAERRIGSPGFVHVERTSRLPRPHLRRGIPVAPAHRAILDAARSLTDEDAVVAMMAEAIRRRRCTPGALARELGAGSRSGSGFVRRALAPLLAGTWSVAEADAWRLWRRSGLPACRWNVKLFDPAGRYIAAPDAWWDEVGLAWEIDSRRYHATGQSHAGTLARNTRYLMCGIVVLQTLPARLRRDPDRVISELREAFEVARGRQRPDVRRR